MSTYRTPLVAVAAAMVLVAPAARAEMMEFSADLTAAAQVPPVDSTATGSAAITVDTVASTISWTVTADGLTGEPTAAHIHGPAGPTENAPPTIDMSSAIMEGSADITEAQLADLQAGNTYVNVHTAEFPDGEIRGQVTAAE